MKSILLKISVISSGFASAQFGDWDPGQINTTICVWNQPRAALMRDKIYIDGGSVHWTPGLQDGTYGPVATKGNFQGIIMSYDLSRYFNRDTNVTGILLDGSLSKARGGSGNANGDAPVYYDGALLANDAEFFLYGGAVFEALWDPPAANDTLEYQAHAYGPNKPLWKPNFSSRRLPEGVTRYVAYGGAASAPSENKAWYFSGLTSPSRGPFFWNGVVSPDTRASVPSDTLITLDMASQLTEKWTNSTLPSHIKGRANPEVVWVPVGEQGILVVLGGATYPEWAGESHVSPNANLSAKESPEFMRTIDIYDVANSTWHQQPTSGGPSTRTRGCAVVAPAADRSSFNIYYYGGFDGIHLHDFYDDVWVLSLPSFTWTKISDGKPRHARAGHKCFLPYPDQMMVIGGYTPPVGNTLTCLEGGPIAMLNITSGEWMDGYDPTKYGAYGVHAKVQAAIGGNGAGHATATAPAPSGWATPALGKVFATSYDTGKMKTYSPYEPSGANTTEPPGENPPSSDHGSKGVPNWIAPVLGVVLGLVLLTGGLLLFCIWRRRIAARARSDTPSSHEAMSERLIYWVKGHPPQRSTVMSTHSCCEALETERSPTRESVPRTEVTPVSAIESPSPPCQEMENTQIVELEDTSSPVELHGAGITATDAALRRAGFKPLLTTSNTPGLSDPEELESPVAVSSISLSGSDGTPTSQDHASRWAARKLSATSFVSLSGGEGTNAYSIDNIVSPIGPSDSPMGENGSNADENSAARASPLKNVINKGEVRRQSS